MPTPQRLPDENIFWKDIKASDKVVDNGNAWYVKRADGSKATVYWTGQDAVAAHLFLSKRTKKAPAASRRSKP
jgi:hypothetical protein